MNRRDMNNDITKDVQNLRDLLSQLKTWVSKQQSLQSEDVIDMVVPIIDRLLVLHGLELKLIMNLKSELNQLAVMIEKDKVSDANKLQFMKLSNRFQDILEETSDELRRESRQRTLRK